MRLVEAVDNSNTCMLQLLITTSTAISSRELHQALKLAAKKRFTNGLQMLIKVIHDFSDKDSIESSLLRLAVELDYVELVEMLVQQGCDVNAKFCSNSTLLHQAAQHGSFLCLDVLVEAGANLDAVSTLKETPLLLASKHCRYSSRTLDVLVKLGCNLNCQDNSNRTALHYACYQASGYECLLKAGAVVNMQDCDGNAAIHLAAIEGFDNVIKRLIESGALPNILNAYNKMAVHYLALKNHWEGIEAIGSVGGNLDYLDDDGHTPLWYAINHNRTLAVKSLLICNCNPDSPGCNTSPMKLALSKKLYDVVKLLLLAGCDPSPLYNFDLEITRRLHERQTESRHSIFAEASEEHVDKSELEAWQWFRHWIHNPHSLRHICKLRLRRLFGAQIMQWKTLNLPQAVKQYILLKEVEEFDLDGTLI